MRRPEITLNPPVLFPRCRLCIEINKFIDRYDVYYSLGCPHKTEIPFTKKYKYIYKYRFVSFFPKEFLSAI